MSTGRLGINTHLSVPDSWLCSTPANVIFLAEWRCPRSCQSFRQLSWYSSVQHHRRAWLEKKQQFIWKVWMLTSNPRGGENKTVQEIVRSKGYKLGTWKFPGVTKFYSRFVFGKEWGRTFWISWKEKGDIISPMVGQEEHCKGYKGYVFMGKIPAWKVCLLFPLNPQMKTYLKVH